MGMGFGLFSMVFEVCADCEFVECVYAKCVYAKCEYVECV